MNDNSQTEKKAWRTMMTVKAPMMKKKLEGVFVCAKGGWYPPRRSASARQKRVEWWEKTRERLWLE